MKKITLGILAHVDSGKTTLSEALLFNSGEIRNLGRVDHKNTHLDTNDMEKDRGEMRNLAVESKYSNVLLEHRAILENWLKTTPGPERKRHLRFIPE